MLARSNTVLQGFRQALSRRWLVSYPRAVPVAIFLSVLAIVMLSVYAIEQGERENDDVTMRDAARVIAASIERRGNESSSYLKAAAALFSTVGEVEPELFRRFSTELRLSAGLRGADGIGWAEAISPAELAAFETRIMRQTNENFVVRPAPSGADERLTPVTFLLPRNDRNRRALGYDMYSEPTRRAAMDEAERVIRPIASGKIVLLQEGAGDAPGFLMYMPVFESTALGRRLKGFVYSPFNAQSFIDSAVLPSQLQGMGLRLYDGEPVAENLLAEVRPISTTGHVMTQELAVANRPLLLEIESAKDETLSPLSMATLFFGLSVAALLMLLARLQTQQAREDEATLAHLAQQNSIRDSLTRELNHRVKNTLANVLSIIALTRRRSENIEEFADGLEGRIRALSATHNLLTQSEWGTTALRDVIEAELAPYVGANDAALELDGPEVMLAPNDALSLGLAIHELATNASKYGALSQPGGKVTVSWSEESEGRAAIAWHETGGPPVPQDRKRGFGTELIEKIVAHELRHPVELAFAADGVNCILHVPVRQRGEFQIRQGEE